MADISKIQIESGTYDIKDTTARGDISTLQGSISTLQTNVSNLNTKLYDFPQMQVKSFAHRGLSCCAPDNTLASIIKAGMHGCYGVEIDAQMTLDKEIILMHDATVDATTDGTGTVNELTYAYISSLNIDAGNYLSSLPQQKVPRLIEALNCCNKYNLVPQIELKGTWTTEDLQKLINEIKNANLEKIAIVISFTHAYLQSLRTLNDKIKIMLLAGDTLTDSLIDLAISIGNCGISMPYTVNTNVSQTFRTKMIENNVPFGFWTLNNITDCRDIIKNNVGLSFVVSNYGYGQISRNVKRMIGVLNSNTLKSWNNVSGGSANVAYQYEDFTVTEPSSASYHFEYSIPIYYDESGYCGTPKLHLEGQKGYKYYIVMSGQGFNGFNFNFIRVSDGQYVTIATVMSDIGNAYVTIDV